MPSPANNPPPEGPHPPASAVGGGPHPPAPSPAHAGEGEQERPLTLACEAGEGGATRRVRAIWLLLLLALLVPLALTLAGALTSPPHVKGPPTGRIVYLEADQPSEKTTLLRGLRVLAPDGTERELLHETEPQDTDAGDRTWLTQPCASPDGHWLAYEKQVITLSEEKQATDNQLWLVPLNGKHPRPRLLLDLGKAGLKQFVGLAWTPDSRAVVFLEDATAHFVSMGDGRSTKRPLPGAASLTVQPSISTTQRPAVLPDGSVAFSVLPAAEARRPDGRLALAEGTRLVLRGASLPLSHLNVHWGWSVWGGRHISALRWSPDGKYVAYSVSKPPFEDELFYADIATGNCYQLPVRTGQAAWDWAK